MGVVKKRLWGQEYLDAEATFEKKYRKQPKMLTEVYHLCDLLTNWYIFVLVKPLAKRGKK